jgi:hypothetical protein
MRLVRGVTAEFMDSARFQHSALLALQEEAENALVREFESKQSNPNAIYNCALTASSDQSRINPCQAGHHTGQRHAARTEHQRVHDRI